MSLLVTTVVVALNNATYEITLAEKQAVLVSTANNSEVIKAIRDYLGPDNWAALMEYQEQVANNREAWEVPPDNIKRILRRIGDFIWRKSDFYKMHMNLDQVRDNDAWQSDGLWE